MDDKIKFNMDENKKTRLILIIGVIAICIFLYFVFVIGAFYSCHSSGGILAKNTDGMRCLQINNTDLCRDYTGKIIKKPESKFNYTLNLSEFDNIGD